MVLHFFLRRRIICWIRVGAWAACRGATRLAVYRYVMLLFPSLGLPQIQGMVPLTVSGNELAPVCIAVELREAVTT